MSYQKHTWVTNEIIRGKQLNHMEEGIYNEEQRATNAEEVLSQAITDEATRATTQEGLLSNRITTNTQDIATLNASASTVGSVDYKIQQAMADTGGYKVVTDHTLVSNPSSKYIYLEPDPSATGSDIFEEWIYYYDDDQSVYVWAMIGETSLDLSDYVKTSELASVATSGSYNDLSDTPTVPTKTSDLRNDSGFINYKAVSTVANQGLSDTEKANARSNIGAGASSFSGSYNDLTDKPTLGTAAAKDVAASGDASSSQVVKGDDTRLTDARTPTLHSHTGSDITDLAEVATSGSYNDLSDTPTIPGGAKIGTTRANATDTTLYFIRS